MPRSLFFWVLPLITQVECVCVFLSLLFGHTMQRPCTAIELLLRHIHHTWTLLRNFSGVAAQLFFLLHYFKIYNSRTKFLA